MPPVPVPCVASWVGAHLLTSAGCGVGQFLALNITAVPGDFLSRPFSGFCGTRAPSASGTQSGGEWGRCAVSVRARGGSSHEATTSEKSCAGLGKSGECRSGVGRRDFHGQRDLAWRAGRGASGAVGVSPTSFYAGTASRRGVPSAVDLVPHVTGRSSGPSLLAIFADPSVLRDAARRVLASPSCIWPSLHFLHMLVLAASCAVPVCARLVPRSVRYSGKYVLAPRVVLVTWCAFGLLEKLIINQWLSACHCCMDG